MRSTLLLTGASGFLGSNLFAALRRAGFSVVGISRSGRPPASYAVNLMNEREVRDTVHAVRPTHLVHAAWLATPGIFWDSAENRRWAAASQTLLEQCYMAGARVAVGIGSCAERQPTSEYAAAKAHFCREAFAISAGMERTFSWARIFFLYGVGEPQEKFISSTAAKLLAGQRVLLRSPNRRVDFIHVRDAARAVADIVANPVAQAFDIGSGEAVRIEDAAKIIAARCVADGLLETADSGEQGVVRADIGEMQRAYDWAPRVTLEAGIAQLVANLRSQICG